MEAMETKTITVEVPKEIAEVGEALGEILKVIGQSLADGWSAADDIPAIVTTTLMNLVKAIDGAQKIPDEFINDPVLATLGIVNPALIGVKEMIKIKK